MRMLQRVKSKRGHFSKQSWRDKSPTAQFIASIMFYRLGIEARVSAEISLEGRLEGVEVVNLTPMGRKYSNVLSMGTKVMADTGSVREKEERRGTTHSELVPESLHFSIHINPRADDVLVSSRANDAHLTLLVPAIHYTYSVNLLYELELFVFELQLYSSIIMDSFSSAAVGMAKDLSMREVRLQSNWASFPPPSGHGAVFQQCKLLPPQKCNQQTVSFLFQEVTNST